MFAYSSVGEGGNGERFLIDQILYAPYQNVERMRLHGFVFFLFIDDICRNMVR